MRAVPCVERATSQRRGRRHGVLAGDNTWVSPEGSSTFLLGQRKVPMEAEASPDPVPLGSRLRLGAKEPWRTWWRPCWRPVWVAVAGFRLLRLHLASRGSSLCSCLDLQDRWTEAPSSGEGALAPR